MSYPEHLESPLSMNLFVATLQAFGLAPDAVQKILVPVTGLLL